MNVRQDFFISHASDDKSAYIQPLAECLTKRKITFWLDTFEVGWGDSLALKVNQGLRESRHVLICLSEAFLSRRWPETELNAAFAINAEDASHKVLPLILNSKDRIIEQYPLVAGLVYREYGDPERIAGELAVLTNNESMPDGHIRVVIESIHTGRLSNVVVSSRSSIEWLADMARRGAGLRDSLETGAFQRFGIRWVLVDVNAEGAWKAMNYRHRQEAHAVVKTANGIQVAVDKRQSLETLSVLSDTVFHFYAVEDADRNDPYDRDVVYHL